RLTLRVAGQRDHPRVRPLRRMGAAGDEPARALGVKSQEVVHPSLVWEAGGCETTNHPSTEARMNIHQHARTTPRSRGSLVTAPGARRGETGVRSTRGTPGRESPG